MIEYISTLELFISVPEPANDEYVKICKENNININVWTVDNISDAFNLIDMGVDYITSNILE